jgi:hypothetical protein
MAFVMRTLAAGMQRHYRAVPDRLRAATNFA